LTAFAPHSGDWLLALPISSYSLKLDDEACSTRCSWHQTWSSLYLWYLSMWRDGQRSSTLYSFVRKSANASQAPRSAWYSPQSILFCWNSSHQGNSRPHCIDAERGWRSHPIALVCRQPLTHYVKTWRRGRLGLRLSMKQLEKSANIQSCHKLIFSNQLLLKILTLLTALPLTLSMSLTVASVHSAAKNAKVFFSFNESLSPCNVSTPFFYTTVLFAMIRTSSRLFPIAFDQTFGPINLVGTGFVSALGHRISPITDDPRKTFFFFQRVYVAIQWF